MLKVKHLNFNWLFCPYYQDEHLRDYANHEGFLVVDLPHSSQEYAYNYLNEPACFGKYTYKYCLKKEELDLSTDVCYSLLFKGVAHQAEVYLNDYKLICHQGGYDEFTVDLTKALKKDTDNWISVIVDESENPDIPPFGGMMDYLGYGGIYREVQLLTKNPDCFQEVIIKSNEQMDGFVLEAEINGQADYIQGTVFFHKSPVETFQVELRNSATSFFGKINNLQKWDLQNPNLYDFHLQLIKDKNIVDETRIRFGFRKIKFTRRGFYLNDEPLKLRGLNRHQSYPYVGYAMPKSAQVQDVKILKNQLGVNIVRTSHYPVSEHFLNACDELGLLVMEEIPGWQHLGGEQFQNNVLKNTQAMITRDRHHPSIILWGVRINESADLDSLYRETNKLAKKLDPTRPTGGVRNFANSHMFEDVYTFNDFTHAGKKAALQKASKIKKGKPYLVTEHNGHMFPTKPFDDEKHRVSQALRHEAVLKAAQKQAQIAGCIGWCMNDYQTHPQFGSGDKICYHGVLDMFRLPKYAAFLYAAQQDKQAVLEVLSTLNPGDYPKSYLNEVYIATNCDCVKIYKDDYFLGEYHPNKPTAFLKPLLKVTDFIGNYLVEKYHFTKFDARLAKQIFKQIQKNPNLPFIFRLKMLYIMLKYRLSRQKATEVFYQLTGGANTFRFEAYQKGTLVKQVIKEKQTSSKWLLEADDDKLVIAETYDVVRVVVKKVDQNHQVLPYAFDAFTISVQGGISLIGPALIALRAGQAAFWVRTKGKAQDGKITITNQEMVLTKTIKVEVKGK
ncbi:MAG TPA: glycoside hydrolase family 2 TIM barrel-domain containing protein [Bacilli bacterium]|nr:MAG: Beta-galactosidase [Tenericutes bacterium ADurb.BinA124]HNZ50146.1 glycoside hydrolase family 2 TIM barrel-domain containing protein [Bacilli bacterium]HPX84036.1 glycoside hydrolase family 2 TIM barrel-domain containing protein [Bacilli bacterium]HQC74046.1 glycoside hydrolase family 2 TIM barrel-domain containing protein [Bacilli bacterium]